MAALLLLAGAASLPERAHASAEARLPAPTPYRVLSTSDAKTYLAAFAAVRKGDFDTVDQAIENLDDEALVGRLLLLKIMHPAYKASNHELKTWLDKYRDQPGADRVWTLAMRRKAVAEADAAKAADDAAQAIKAGASEEETDPAWARVERAIEHLEVKAPKPKIDPKLQAAREAYYSGEIDKAYKLATQSGERWVGGLSAYRLGKYSEAMSRFAALADDAAANEWVRSAAAYWASRAAIAAGEAQRAPAFLEKAARTPYTFYGLIAERQLGLEPAVTSDGLDLGETLPNTDKTSAAAAQAAATGLSQLVKKDKRAHRAAAYAQLGMRLEAGLEVRTALMAAGKTGDRKKWTSLAAALGAPVTAPGDVSRGRGRFDIAQFPLLDVEPEGGFTQDRALIHALVRQESRFNAEAVSTSGAYGLMMLMPQTAAIVAKDDKLARDPTPLKNPTVNLKLGQDYVAYLLSTVKGDILHAVAAYNAGPGVILKTAKQMGERADSLLMIESMPGAQTREFVQRVMSNYWIYKSILRESSGTLDACAQAARAIRADLDKPPMLDLPGA